MLDCINYCIKNKIKTILISEVDRFSRNVQTAKDILEMVNPFGIKFIFSDVDIDTSKSSKQISKLLDYVELSHYELKKIKYRLDSGREKYIENGGRLGRKPGFKMSKEQRKTKYANVLNYIFDEDKYSLRKIAEKCGVSVNTVRCLKKEFEEDYKPS